MSVFEQHKAALASIISSYHVSEAFVLDQEICKRLAAVTSPDGSKPLASLESNPACTVLRLCCAVDGIDRVAVVDSEGARLIQVTDIVTYDEELSPLQLVEYRFTADGEWRTCQLSEETLGFLKETKHKAWREGMLSIFGNCAKAFIPSLKQGLITRMFDHQMFVDNSPEGASYIVTNDQGEKFRVWDSSTANYKSVSSHLQGVPETAEAQQKYWEEFLAELRRATSSKFGAEFIDDCMSMDVSEVKLKYGA